MQPDFIYDGDSIGVGIMMKQADIYIYIYICLPSDRKYACN
jgi:hypothetical protein